ncbi:MAG: TonB family protein [Proteobacteria bacterium]|nr:TonB family protein [Pseudomonadota bacterium]
MNINVVEKPKPNPEPEARAPEPPRPKPPSPTKATQSPTKSSMPATEPVLGLNKDSFAENGQGTMAVPAGNTTMVEDLGKRLSPEDIKKLDRDLSEDARLVTGSFVKPAYTPEAEDASLEGTFIIEVFVDANGLVKDAELRTKIGYGMDQKVLDAARNSRFSPRKNPLGQALSGWTELKIRLSLE